MLLTFYLFNNLKYLNFLILFSFLILFAFRYFYISYKMKTYLYDFLPNPHKNLGRKGDVCPFMKKAIKLNSLEVKYYPLIFFEKTLENIILNNFEKIRNKNIYNSIIMIFPDTQTAKILKIQKKLKKYIVSEGYLIGEFYQNNLQTGLHNNNFFPLQTIVGCIALIFIPQGYLKKLNVKEYHIKSSLKIHRYFQMTVDLR